MNNRSLTYEIQIGPNQQSVYLDPIEILDDLDVEGDESFFIVLTAGAAIDNSGYAIDFDRMVATVIINVDGKH